MSVTQHDIAQAWHRLLDEWFSRRNKAYEFKQYEVVHSWGGNLISDDTQRVIGRYETSEQAERAAARAENHARADAVLKMLRRKGISVD